MVPVDVEDFVTIRSRRAARLAGIKHALAEPAAILFLALISYGVAAADAGLSNLEALMSTALLWALPAQMAHVETIVLGSGLLLSVTAVALTNLRFVPMIISLLPQLRLRGCIRSAMASHLVSATSWAWCMEKIPYLPVPYRLSYFFSFSLCCWLGGLAGTGAGLLLADMLPPLLKLLTLYIAPLYMLLLLAGVRGHRLLALLIGAAAGVLLYLAGSEWYLPAAALLGGTGGFLARPTS